MIITYQPQNILKIYLETSNLALNIKINFQDNLFQHFDTNLEFAKLSLEISNKINNNDLTTSYVMVIM